MALVLGAAISLAGALNTYLRSLASPVRELPMDDENVLLDLDTPEDYDRLRQRYERPR